VSLVVDRATPADAPVLSTLIEEIELHYGATDLPPTPTAPT
jgi:hypothetical protein